MNLLSSPRRLLGVSLVFGVILSGQASQLMARSRGPTISISEEELRAKVDAMASSYSGQMGALAIKVASETPSNDIRRAVLYFKMRFITTVETAVDVPNPLTAYLDLWALSFQMEIFTGKGNTETNAASILGEFLPQYVEFFKGMHADFEKEAATFIPKDRLQETIAGVGQYVKDYAIQGEGGTIARINFSDTAVGGLLGGVMSLPMAPFAAMEGVGKGGEAAQSIAEVAAEFKTVVQRLPEHIGWQLEMLLLNSRRDADEMFAQLLDESNKQMEGVQTALTQVQDALKEIQTVGTQAEAVTSSVERTVTALDTSAGALDTLLKTYKDTMMTLYPPDTPEQIAAKAAREAAHPSPPSKPFDIDDYTKALAGLTQAAEELQALLTEIKTTLDGPALNNVIDGATKVTSAALEESTRSVDALVRYAYGLAIRIVLMIFGLAVVFLILSRWVIRQKSV